MIQKAIFNNLIITNYGYVDLEDDLYFRNASATWINEENSTLVVGDYYEYDGIYCLFMD